MLLPSIDGVGRHEELADRHQHRDTTAAAALTRAVAAVDVGAAAARESATTRDNISRLPHNYTPTHNTPTLSSSSSSLPSPSYATSTILEVPMLRFTARHELLRQPPSHQTNERLLSPL